MDGAPDRRDAAALPAPDPEPATGRDPHGIRLDEVCLERGSRIEQLPAPRARFILPARRDWALPRVVSSSELRDGLECFVFVRDYPRSRVSCRLVQPA